MVLEYMKNGSMYQYLKNNYNRLNLHNKLGLFLAIAQGLREIHNKGFIHKDLHSSNILGRKGVSSIRWFITDLGLCKPVDEQDEKKIHGVLPYVAPEVSSDKTYTLSADIYSFGILACEIISGLPPYHYLSHDEILALKICQGLRPKFNIKVPILLKNLIDQCLDADPLKRPTIDELFNIICNWRDELEDKEDTEFYKQFIEVDGWSCPLESNTSLNISSYITHPHAIYTSRLLNYKNLPEPQNSKEINVQFYTEFPGNYYFV